MSVLSVTESDNSMVKHSSIAWYVVACDDWLAGQAGERKARTGLIVMGFPLRSSPQTNFISLNESVIADASLKHVSSGIVRSEG